MKGVIWAPRVIEEDFIEKFGQKESLQRYFFVDSCKIFC